MGDSLSEEFAGCLASGLRYANPHTDIFLYPDSYDQAPPKIDRVVPLPTSFESDGDEHWETNSSSDFTQEDDDRDSNWESCSDSDNEEERSNYDSYCDSNRDNDSYSNRSSNSTSDNNCTLSMPATDTTRQLSAVNREPALRLLLPYPSSGTPGIISSWWQDHQFLIVDSIFFHGYKFHPLDIEHWLGLQVDHKRGPPDTTYPQLCKDRVAGLSDYLYVPDYSDDYDDEEVPSRGCVYSKYVITLLNELLGQLLGMHKLRVAHWPSPCSFKVNSPPCSTHCLPFSAPHAPPPTYIDIHDHCKSYNEAWYKTHYSSPDDWYDTTDLTAIVSTPETSARIARQLLLYTKDTPSYSHGLRAEPQSVEIPVPSQCTLSEDGHQDPDGTLHPEYDSSPWDSHSAASTHSYLSASDVPLWVPLPPEIHIPWTGPTAIQRLLVFG